MPRQLPRENTGSYARDHLANERTFLAWLRTALAFMGLGILVAKFLEGTEFAFAAGLVLIVIGSGMLIYSVIRYERLAGSIDRGQYQPARWGPALFGFFTLAAALVAVILVLV